jgi:hypothetical protein
VGPAHGWDRDHRPALYLVGFFEVELAGMASKFDKKLLESAFRNNFHVRYPTILEQQMDHLVLVKGSPRSRMFRKAYQISDRSNDRANRPLKVLSEKMQRYFGTFPRKNAIQRSTPRWVEPQFVETAIEFVKGLG